MIDYDEMNEVLAQAERALAEEEAARERELDRAAQELPKEKSYEACLDGLQRVRIQITRMQTWVYEDFERTEAEESCEFRNLVGLLIGYAFHTLVYPLFFALIAKVHFMAAAAFGLIGLLWLYYTATFTIRVLDYVTTYRVMMSHKGTVPYAEDQRILTYRARKERCQRRLKTLQDQSARLDACEKQVHRQQGLTGTAFDSLQALINVPESREEYSDKTAVTFGEYRAWKRQQRRKRSRERAAEEAKND